MADHWASFVPEPSRIALYRRLAAMSRFELAEELRTYVDVEVGDVARWERGSATPSLDQAGAICMVLHVPRLNWLRGASVEVPHVRFWCTTGCVWCADGTAATRLCDGQRDEGTCDAPICTAHARAIGENRDLCPDCVKRRLLALALRRGGE
jgi:DNA-binding XRE family transcriptional regulator